MTVREVKTSMPSSVEHGGTKGTVLPVGAISKRESSPKQGTIRANSSTKELELFIGNTWTTYEPKVVVDPTAVTSFTAKAPGTYPVDTANEVIEVTLPTNARVGQTVTLVDSNGTWDTNNVHVNGNGYKIDNSNKAVVLSIKGSIVTFFFSGTSGWISDLAPSGLPSNDVSDSDWPLALRANQSYYISLVAENENEVTLPEGNMGDQVRLVVINNKLFKDIPLTVKTTGDVNVAGEAYHELNLDTSEASFEYRGDEGWVYLVTGQRFQILHNHVLTEGSLNGFITEGSHKVDGPISKFSMLPLTLSSESFLLGSLQVTWNGTTCTQELTVVVSTSKSNTRKFLRTGIVTGTNVNFSNAWIELSGIPDNSRRVISEPDDLFKDLTHGHYYVVNPDVGTPDHEEDDVYLVEVVSSGLAKPNSQVSYTTRHIKAWNINKRQWWESTSVSLTTSSAWRKLNANHTVNVSDGDSVDYRPLAPVTNIWVDGEGNQTINLNCASSVSNLESAKIGDVIVIHNLRKDVKQTVVNSSIDIVDSEGDNIGKGPHSMTGKGALKLLLESDADGTVYFKQLFGVRS